MYKREVVEFSSAQKTAAFPPYSMPADHARPSAANERSRLHKRKRSVELTKEPVKRHHCFLSKTTGYKFGDVFCGIGGTSQGARAAGWTVVFGVENNHNAMQAYRANFPNALHLEIDAHNFASKVNRCIHGVDITHFSCPCQFWSCNQ